MPTEENNLLRQLTLQFEDVTCSVSISRHHDQEQKSKPRTFCTYANPPLCTRLPVDLTEHQIHRTDNSYSISQKVTTGHLIEAAQMSEPGRTDLAPVRALGTIGNNVHTHLTLRRLNGSVRLSRRYSVTLGIEQKVVNQRLHVFLHRRSGRGRDFVVLNTNWSRGHFIQALQDDAQRLTELLHSTEVTVIAVSVLADGNVELHLPICIVRVGLTDIPGHTGTTKHDAGETIVQSVGSWNHTDTNSTTFPDSIVGEKLLYFIDAVPKLSSPLVDVVEKAEGEILVNTAGADVSGVESSTRDTLIEFLQRLLA